eukprot:GHVT01062744.1.p1 GENE.GHVT01062744.1~~GHVT01062744.1.p1  ORF type:complete len:408 (+),score=104.90 GHVT01062744.1:1554-2777(+)
MGFCASEGKVLSVGFDASLRLLDEETAKLLAGGRVSNRIGDGGGLTACHLDIPRARATVGSSTGDVICFKVQTSPCAFEFLAAAKVHPQEPVAAIQATKSQLFIGHGDVVSLYTFVPGPRDRAEAKAAQTLLRAGGQLVSQLEAHRAVVSMRLDLDRKRLLVGYQLAIIAWDLNTGRALCAWAAHLGGVAALTFLPSSDGLLLLSAGDSGNVKLWSLPGNECFQFWSSASDGGERGDEYASEGVSGLGSGRLLGVGEGSRVEDGGGGREDVGPFPAGCGSANLGSRSGGGSPSAASFPPCARVCGAAASFPDDRPDRDAQPLPVAAISPAVAQPPAARSPPSHVSKLVSQTSRPDDHAELPSTPDARSKNQSSLKSALPAFARASSDDEDEDEDTSMFLAEISQALR